VLASGIFALKAPQTDKEMSDAYRSMVAYSGKFTLELEGNKWITEPDVAWNEAWLVDQERYCRIEGDKLYIETAPQLNPNFGKAGACHLGLGKGRIRAGACPLNSR
jgi:Lipocalin-like domain